MLQVTGVSSPNIGIENQNIMKVCGTNCDWGAVTGEPWRELIYEKSKVDYFLLSINRDILWLQGPPKDTQFLSFY